VPPLPELTGGVAESGADDHEEGGDGHREDDAEHDERPGASTPTGVSNACRRTWRDHVLNHVRQFLPLRDDPSRTA